jgi:hypothetical protein
MPGLDQIRVSGHLDSRWAAAFADLRLIQEQDGTTVISGIGDDQAALHGLLRKVRDLGLPLVSVTRSDTPATTSRRAP